MIKYPSTNQFREVKRNVEFDVRYRGLDENEQPTFEDVPLPIIPYQGTVKLHGTNAAINYTDGINFQSRENVITPQNDNAGFATWASGLPQSFHDTIKEIYGDNVVVFGEWCGGNVQKGVAITGLPKMFVIFGVQKITEDETKEVWLNLDSLFNKTSKLNEYGVYLSTQFKTYWVDIDFNNPEPALDKINAWTLEVEKECPVGRALKEKLGRVGEGNSIGEGIVWTPCIITKIRSRLTFKTKGSEHSKVVNKKLAAVDPEKVKSIEDFVDKHVNEERLNQAYTWLAQMGHSQNEKSTGHFVKWVVGDVLKEEKDELLHSNLSEKEVNSLMSTKARKWFFAKFNK